jgi:alpha-L-glutamate ligase-like protein
LGVIQTTSDILNFKWEGLPDRFAVKPNSGFGGEGIIVLNKKIQSESGEISWRASNGEMWNVKQLQAHTLNILDGSYSLSNSPDIAFFEEKIINAPEMREIGKYGIPDIRVIVFNRVPVMTMLRVPTLRSQGKANLAKGAIGCGIDMSLGVTTTAIIEKPRQRIIEKHPDSGFELAGFQIPYWNEILEHAIRCQDVTNLGYIGVDLAIDKYNGPVILELNARPGLGIQVANLAPLKDRLRRVRGLKVATEKKALSIGKDLFGGDIERRVEDVSGYKLVGAVELIKLVSAEKKLTQTLARMDTGENMSLIDEALATKLALPIRTEELTKMKKKSRVVSIVMYLGGERRETLMKVADLSKNKSKVIIGRRDLRGFLVDPSKKA